MGFHQWGMIFHVNCDTVFILYENRYTVSNEGTRVTKEKNIMQAIKESLC
jgi:hypothetical protein